MSDRGCLDITERPNSGKHRKTKRRFWCSVLTIKPLLWHVHKIPVGLALEIFQIQHADAAWNIKDKKGTPCLRRQLIAVKANPFDHSFARALQAGADRSPDLDVTALRHSFPWVPDKSRCDRILAGGVRGQGELDRGDRPSLTGPNARGRRSWGRRPRLPLNPRQWLRQ